jgi:SPP1 family predicted phage head-tail adaptor
MKCSQVCSGDFRTLVLVQDEDLTDDGYGGQTVAFTTIAEPFAKVVSKRGGEGFGSSSRRSTATYEMTMRYNPEITAKMRVTWKGKTGTITEVDNLEERDVYTVLTVEENIGE